MELISVTCWLGRVAKTKTNFMGVIFHENSAKIKSICENQKYLSLLFIWKGYILFNFLPRIQYIENKYQNMILKNIKYSISIRYFKMKVFLAISIQLSGSPSQNSIILCTLCLPTTPDFCQSPNPATTQLNLNQLYFISGRSPQSNSSDLLLHPD